MASNDRESVRVIIRCRPFSIKEKDEGHSDIVSINLKSGSIAVQVPDKTNEPPKQFSFDFAFDTKTTQMEVYQSAAKTIVDGVLNGYNGTIFA